MPIQQPSLRLMNTLLNAETRRIAVFTTGNGYRRLVAGRGHNGTHEPSMRSLYRFSNAANFWSRSILRSKSSMRRGSSSLFGVCIACDGMAFKEVSLKPLLVKHLDSAH